MPAEIVGLTEHTFAESFSAITELTKVTPRKTGWIHPFTPPDLTAPLSVQAQKIEVARLTGITTPEGLRLPQELYAMHNRPGTFTYEHWNLAHPEEVTVQASKRAWRRYANASYQSPPMPQHRILTIPTVCEIYGGMAVSDDHLALVAEQLRSWCEQYESSIKSQVSRHVGDAISACIMRSAALLDYDPPPERFLSVLGGNFGPFQDRYFEVMISTLHVLNYGGKIHEKAGPPPHLPSKRASKVAAAFKSAGLFRPMPQPLAKEPSRKATARTVITHTADVPLDQAPPKTDEETITPILPSLGEPPVESSPDTLKAHIRRRLPPVAEALRTNRLPELYHANALEHITVQHLHKCLDTPALAAYMNEVFVDWRDQGFALDHFPSLGNRQYLRQQFLAQTPAQLIALAGEAGVVECPPLELTQPYIFNDFEVTVVGLLRYGLEAPEMAQIFSVPRITDYTVRLFDNLVARLPVDEPRPQKQNGAWFVYTARRLGLFAFTKSEASYFAKDTLKKFMGFLFDERRDFYPLRDA